MVKQKIKEKNEKQEKQEKELLIKKKIDNIKKTQKIEDEKEEEMKFDFSIILKKNEIINKISNNILEDLKKNEKSKKKKEKKKMQKLIEEINGVIRDLDERLCISENKNSKLTKINEEKENDFINKINNLEKENKNLKIEKKKFEEEMKDNYLNFTKDMNNKINDLKQNYENIIFEKEKKINKCEIKVKENFSEIENLNKKFSKLQKEKNNEKEISTILPLINKEKKDQLLKNDSYEKNLKKAIFKEDYLSIEILSEKINISENLHLIQSVLKNTFNIKKYKIFFFLLKKGFYFFKEISSINILLKKIDFNFCEENLCIEIIKVLLEKKFNINHIDQNGESPLIISVRKNKIKIVNFLISKKCDLDIKNKNNENSLFLACQNGNFKIIKSLIKNNCRVGFKQNDLKIPLCVLISQNLFKNEKLNEKILIFLIDSGVNFNNIYNDVNCLYYIIQKKKIDLINYLIIYEIKINKIIIDLLCELGNYKIFSIFENLIKFDQEDKYFEKAVNGGNIKIIEYFSINSPVIYISLKIMNSFFKLIKNEKLKNIEIILINLIKKSKSNSEYGNELIHFVVKLNQSLSLLKLIIKLGGNINQKNNLGTKPLLLACSFNNNIEIIKYLIKLGSNVKEKNNQGQKCIHLAAFNKNLDILKYIFSLDSDIYCKDKYGHSPIDYSGEVIENYKFLSEKGSDQGYKYWK